MGQVSGRATIRTQDFLLVTLCLVLGITLPLPQRWKPLPLHYNGKYFNRNTFTHANKSSTRPATFKSNLSPQNRTEVVHRPCSDPLHRSELYPYCAGCLLKWPSPIEIYLYLPLGLFLMETSPKQLQVQAGRHPQVFLLSSSPLFMKHFHNVSHKSLIKRAGT